jgi:Protein of unknown function with PCYCGC motif
MAQTKRKGAVRTAPRIPAFIWALVAVLAFAIGYRVMAGRNGSGHHPQPRENIALAAAVVDATRYASDPDVADVYRMAKAIPEILDGIHCYCECARNFGHYSLLTCFQSDHGAGCDTCLREVMIAYQLSQQGQSLTQIRAQIDAMMTG